METVSYERTNRRDIPAIIHIAEKETPVWIQSAWTDGEYAQYIRRNGCGHCCAAMAATLQGVNINPYQAYMLCRQLWGAPDEAAGQDHFQTVAGIVKILHHLNIPAQHFGVAAGEQMQATSHILSCLKQNQQVIFVSDPFRNPGNIFSTGYHYVMAVGFDTENRIVIANSSEKVSVGGVQTVAPEIITAALFQGGTAEDGMTWGIVEKLHEGCTYVVVG